MSKLSDKQRRFCEEYVVDQNGTQAAIRAGYSEKSARAQAAKMLTKGNIDAYIAELQGDLSARTEVTAEIVVQELAKMAFANLGDYFDGFGTELRPSGLQDSEGEDIMAEVPFAVMKSKTELTRSQMAAISQISISHTQYGPRLTFKLHDKTKAQELLMRHLGMFNDKVEVTQRPYVIEVPSPSESVDEWAAEANGNPS